MSHSFNDTIFRENLDKKDLLVVLVLLVHLAQVGNLDQLVHRESLVLVVNLEKEADLENRDREVQ